MMIELMNLKEQDSDSEMEDNLSIAHLKQPQSFERPYEFDILNGDLIKVYSIIYFIK